MTQNDGSKSARIASIVVFYVPATGALCLAQLINAMVNAWIQIGESVSVTSFFFLTHVRNFGGIFGLQQGKGWVFAGVSVLVLGAVIFFVHRSPQMRRIELWCLGLVVGGGLSNVFDRIAYGSVVDYFDVRGIPHWAYIFNTADVLIHLGIWPIILMGLLARKRGKAEG